MSQIATAYTSGGWAERINSTPTHDIYSYGDERIWLPKGSHYFVQQIEGKTFARYSDLRRAVPLTRELSEMGFAMQTIHPSNSMQAWRISENETVILPADAVRSVKVCGLWCALVKDVRQAQLDLAVAELRDGDSA